MSLDGLYSLIGSLGIAAEVVLLIILCWRREYRSFPVFTLYIAYNVLSDAVILGSMIVFSSRVGRPIHFATVPLQYLLELAVLFEIAWKVLRPVQSSVPKGLLRAFLVLVAGAIVGGTMLAWHVQATGNLVDELEGPLILTIGLLRMLVFAAIAGFAQILGIGWKDRVLQLATALSFYSAVDLMVTLAERHNHNSSTLDPLRALCYLLELCFLVWAFTTKEVRRAEFSPQMEQFLVTLAGRAKSAKTALVRR